MKKLALFLFTIAICQINYGQFDQKLRITANIGFINLTNIGFTAVEASDNGEFNRIGPFLIRGEYEVNPKLNLGISVGFLDRDFQFSTTRTDGTTTTQFDNYVKSNSLKIMAGLTYNLIQREKYELFGLLNLGYQMTTWEVKFEDYQDRFDEAIQQLPIAQNILPKNQKINRVRFDLMLGNRFWLTKNVGINLEFGFNSLAIIQSGIILRL